MKTIKVIYKQFPENEAIALFPNEKWNYDGSLITSYMRVGQHGAASPELIKNLPDATPKQIKELKQELIQVGYNV
jgi:hypothetical protein